MELAIRRLFPTHELGGLNSWGMTSLYIHISADYPELVLSGKEVRRGLRGTDLCARRLPE